MPIDLGARHVIAALVGLAVALLVLRPWLRPAELRRGWPQAGAAAAAIVLLVPVLVVLVDHTRFFVERDMREVGSPAFGEPIVSEEAAEATRAALRPGDTWAYTTEGGPCTELHGYYWLMFRFVPNEPDCDDPDVELFWQREPPSGAEVVADGEAFAVVRR